MYNVHVLLVHCILYILLIYPTALPGILIACGMVLYPFSIQIDKFTSLEQSIGANFILAYFVWFVHTYAVRRTYVVRII